MSQSSQQTKSTLWLLVSSLPMLLLFTLFIVAVSVNNNDSNAFLEYMKYAYPIMMISGVVGVVTLLGAVIKLEVKYRMVAIALLSIHLPLLAITAVSYLSGIG